MLGGSQKAIERPRFRKPTAASGVTIHVPSFDAWIRRASLAATMLSVTACATPDRVARDAPSPPDRPRDERAASTLPAPREEAAPIVVELFSSEGCSSCPSADRVLRALVDEQPVAGARVIGLELHVDYWNYLGWADPFSSASYSARQERYSQKQGRRGAYTPQMVVDGGRELIGSNASGAREAIEAAARAPKAKVTLTKNGDELAITVEDVPTGGPLDVLLAVTESGLSTDVPRGENAGETLAHGPVVRSLERVGRTGDGSATLRAPIPATRVTHRERAHVVAFVQRGEAGAIVGAAELPLL